MKNAAIITSLIIQLPTLWKISTNSIFRFYLEIEELNKHLENWIHGNCSSKCELEVYRNICYEVIHSWMTSCDHQVWPLRPYKLLTFSESLNIKLDIKYWVVKENYSGWILRQRVFVYLVQVWQIISWQGIISLNGTDQIRARIS